MDQYASPKANSRLWVCVGCGNTQWTHKKINPNTLVGYKCWKCKGTKWQ